MKIRFDSTWLALPAACIALTWPVSTVAASFDCSKIGTAIEATICDVPALSRLDDRLDAAYRHALARNPAERNAQRDWMAIRDRCEDQSCLVDAYERRLQELESRTQQQATVAEEIPVPAQAAVSTNNPLAVMMDVTYFYGVSDLDMRSLWSDKNGVLFEKRIVDWTDDDFTLLEQKLKQQIPIEWEAAVARRDKVAGMGYQASPVENDHDYSFRKGVIDKVLASIPKYKYLANQTREANAQSVAAAAAESEKQRALKAQEEEERAAALQRQQAQQNEAQAQTAQSNKMLIVYAIIAAVLAFWIWNKFYRLRCARCKSTNIETLGVNEVDRWRGTKQVTERNTRGTRTRHVSTTFVKNEYHYECRDCGTNWLKRKKEEL